MVETHPFGDFVPKDCEYFLLGSFAAKPVDGYDWFFANKRNQFWWILEQVYNLELDTKVKQQDLFQKLRLGISDIILSCERRANSNLDTNLSNLVLNSNAIRKIWTENEIGKIFFSSRFAENLYRHHLKDLIEKHPHIQLITLPSPSPRYATMSKFVKVSRYAKVLPTLA